jgi:Protein of unknown function
MSARSDEYVDGLVLSFAQVQWRKVAMIMSPVVNECSRHGGDADWHDVAERICALVEDGQLEAQGDLSMWRHSEVGLPPRSGRSSR